MNRGDYSDTMLFTILLVVLLILIIQVADLLMRPKR